MRLAKILTKEEWDTLARYKERERIEMYDIMTEKEARNFVGKADTQNDVDKKILKNIMEKVIANG